MNTSYCLQASFTMDISEDDTVSAYAGFFDTEFKGSQEHPVTFPVTLSTAPDPTGATHWGQQSFLLQPSIDVNAGDKINCDFVMQRRKDNHRLLAIKLNQQVISKTGEQKIARCSNFIID